MVRSVLEERNRALLRDVQLLARLLDAARPPTELAPYHAQVKAICQLLLTEVEDTRNLLAGNVVQHLPEALSKTRVVTQALRWVNGPLTAPIFRASDSDRLSLVTIGWLHSAHPSTAPYPPAFSEGQVAILPLIRYETPVYFFPSVEQRGLLFQPLLFHEFGHLLYACHRDEMNDLVDGLQVEIRAALLAVTTGGDGSVTLTMAELQNIINVWYLWAQELFCDAVGLDIGGPSYLYAFSAYLSEMTAEGFYLPAPRLQASTHPLPGLRIKLLAKRGRRQGYGDLAGEIEQTWSAVATALGVREDYHGFFTPALENAIEKTLADMIEEASPRQCTAEEVVGSSDEAPDGELVPLFNRAWRIYRSVEDETYAQWEEEQINRLLGG